MWWEEDSWLCVMVPFDMDQQKNMGGIPVNTDKGCRRLRVDTLTGG